VLFLLVYVVFVIGWLWSGLSATRPLWLPAMAIFGVLGAFYGGLLSNQLDFKRSDGVNVMWGYYAMYTVVWPLFMWIVGGFTFTRLPTRIGSTILVAGASLALLGGSFVPNDARYIWLAVSFVAFNTAFISTKQQVQRWDMWARLVFWWAWAGKVLYLVQWVLSPSQSGAWPSETYNTSAYLFLDIVILMLVTLIAVGLVKDFNPHLYVTWGDSKKYDSPDHDVIYGNPVIYNFEGTPMPRPVPASTNLPFSGPGPDVENSHTPTPTPIPAPGPIRNGGNFLETTAPLPTLMASDIENPNGSGVGAVCVGVGVVHRPHTKIEGGLSL